MKLKQKKESINLKTKYIYKNRRRLSIALLVMLFSTMFLNIPANMINMDENNNTNLFDENPINTLKVSDIGEDPWWDESFEFRRLLNISNSGSDDFVDNIGTKIVFNYSELVTAGKVNANLSDVRIVENGVERDYYVILDTPVSGNATIWFKCNVSAGAIDYDTYIYYGNSSITSRGNKHYSYNPVGAVWFPFDEGSGTKIIDSADGAQYNINTAGWETGKVGDHCLDLYQDYIPLDNKAAFRTTGNQTISFWLKSFSRASPSRQNFYGKCYGAEGTITLEPAGSLSYYCGQADPPPSGVSGSPYIGRGSGSYTIMDGIWTHMVLRREFITPYSNAYLSTVKWYMDGTQKTTQNTAYGSIGSGGWYFMNSSYSNAVATFGDNYVNPFWGQLDDFRIYDEALTPEEIDWLYRYNYTIDATSLEEFEQGTRISVVVRDVDGRAVPGAQVYLVNYTTTLQNDTVGTDGTASFSVVPYGSYNITVKHSISSGTTTSTAWVYDSSDSAFKGSAFDFQALHETITVKANLTSIDFEIDDYDEDPMNLGLVNMSLTPGGEVIETLTLDSDGKATFQWLNDTQYYYEVYYDNVDYFQQYTLVNQSSVERVQLYYENSFNVNEFAAFFGDDYDFEEAIDAYQNRSRIVSARIKLESMADYMTSVTVQSIDRFGAIGSTIYYESYTQASATTSDIIDLNVLDDYSAYGLNIKVLGNNASGDMNGIITVNFTQSTHHYVQASMSKVSLKVISNTNWDVIPGVYIQVFNSTTGTSIANLTTLTDGKAYTRTQNLSFWYIQDTYNFTLEFFEIAKQFSVNYTDPSAPLLEDIYEYNYTVTEASEIVFELLLNPEQYTTQFIEFNGTTTASWGNNLIYWVNFTSTDPVNGNLTITSGAEVTCDVYLWGSGGQSTLIHSTPMSHSTNGNYTVSIDSSQFSAGAELKYFIEINGFKQGYMAPSAVYMPVTIITIATDWSLHNWSNTAQTISGVSQFFNEKVNATVSYFLNGSSSSRLSGATLSYSWDYGSGSGIGEDPMNPTYYTFEIDTSSAPNIGTFKIDVSISLLNHTAQSFSIFLQVLERSTSLNGSTSLLHVSKRVYLGDAYNFTFEYLDVLSTTRVGSLETITYIWYEIYANGSQKGATSDNLYLDSIANNLYSLDFDTETKTIDTGNSIRFAMFVTMKKNNYEQRMCFIDLTIEKRPITTDSDSFLLSEIQGTAIAFSLILTDPTNSSAPLTGATVRLLIRGSYKNFTETSPGTYTLAYSTSGYDTFLMPATVTGTIYIEKDGYQVTTVPVTVVVGMPEIFPGMPTFYFLMIVGAIVAVAGSLVTYRTVLQRRIPTFVKKVTAMRKSIKSKSSISESNIYPPKEEVMIKLYGDRWKVLGLSLEDILGIQPKKGKGAPSSEIKSKDIGGGDT